MIRTALREVDGPELPPIDARALSRNDFRSVVPGDIFYDRVVCPMPDVDTGKLKWDFIYNLDYMRRHADTAGNDFGRVLISQIVGTVYGPWLEKFLIREDFRSIVQLQKACSGWAAYFSYVPSSPDEIRGHEQIALTTVPTDQLRASADMLRGMFGDPRFFIPLALMKLEQASSTAAAIELMHRPPGLEETEQGCKLEDVMTAFWWIYRNANDRLGAPSLPREVVMNWSDLSEN